MCYSSFITDIIGEADERQLQAVLNGTVIARGSNMGGREGGDLSLNQKEDGIDALARSRLLYYITACVLDRLGLMIA